MWDNQRTAFLEQVMLGALGSVGWWEGLRYRLEPFSFRRREHGSLPRWTYSMTFLSQTLRGGLRTGTGRTPFTVTAPRLPFWAVPECGRRKMTHRTRGLAHSPHRPAVPFSVANSLPTLLFYHSPPPLPLFPSPLPFHKTFANFRNVKLQLWVASFHIENLSRFSNSKG